MYGFRLKWLYFASSYACSISSMLGLNEIARGGARRGLAGS